MFLVKGARNGVATSFSKFSQITGMTFEPLQLDRSPGEVLRDWPHDRPLGVLWSAGGLARSRWTLLACPSGEQLTTLPGEAPRWPRVMTASFENHQVKLRDGERPPFTAGWLGAISYELGRDLEPHVVRSGLSRGDLPTMHWQRFESALVFDHERARWWGIGEGARDLVRGLRPHSPDAVFKLGRLRSRSGRSAFEHAVAQAIEHIRAGDIYQVNLTHRLEGEFEGSSRGLFDVLAAAASPWYGAYLELPMAREMVAIASVSPESFLSYDPWTRRVETRPMKGTRSTGASNAVSAAMRDELLRSGKDQAELAMIVDLMRNDLGRVCEARSIRVEDARAMERHASLLQTTATVSGTLAKSHSLADLLRATFPGGSITGAPKIRAMQIVEELEPLPRGAYCGSVGYVGDDGSLQLNIAIRTAVVRGSAAPSARDGASTAREFDHFANATLSYAVGAGIVADSDPASEWEETLAKAGVIEKLAAIVDRESDRDAMRHT